MTEEEQKEKGQGEVAGKEEDRTRMRVIMPEDCPTVYGDRVFVSEQGDRGDISYAVFQCDDEYVASFYDGNINASGDTPTEAYANLKDMIIGTYELFVDMDEEELGPEPLRQLAVLREVMRER